MIYLDTPNRKLEIVLGGAVSANQPQSSVFYYDVPRVEKTDNSEYRGGLMTANANNTTDVTICAAPTDTSYVRNVRNIDIHNKDTASATVTIKIDDAGTESILIIVALATLESLHYSDEGGFYVLTASGGLKQGGVSVPGSSTDNAVARWDGTTGTAIQNALVIVDDSGNVTGVVGLTITGAFAGGASSNIAINTNKFTVTASSGNTAIAGTLDVTGQVGMLADVAQSWSGRGTGRQLALVVNTGGTLRWGVESSAGGGILSGSSAYAAVFGTTGATAVEFFTNDTLRMSISSAGVVRINGGTTGAQTATFTATNKPGSGTTGPDTWLPINIDGTLHYIPAFQ